MTSVYRRFDGESILGYRTLAETSANRTEARHGRYFKLEYIGRLNLKPTRK